MRLCCSILIFVAVSALMTLCLLGWVANAEELCTAPASYNGTCDVKQNFIGGTEDDKREVVPGLLFEAYLSLLLCLLLACLCLSVCDDL